MQHSIEVRAGTRSECSAECTVRENQDVCARRHQQPAIHIRMTSLQWIHIRLTSLEMDLDTTQEQVNAPGRRGELDSQSRLVPDGNHKPRSPHLQPRGQVQLDSWILREFETIAEGPEFGHKNWHTRHKPSSRHIKPLKRTNLS